VVGAWVGAAVVGTWVGAAVVGAWVGAAVVGAWVGAAVAGAAVVGAAVADFDFLVFLSFGDEGARMGFFFDFFETFATLVATLETTCVVAPGKTVVNEVVMPSTGYDDVVVFTVSVLVLVVLDPLTEVDWEVLVEVVNPPEV